MENRTKNQNVEDRSNSRESNRLDHSNEVDNILVHPGISYLIALIAQARNKAHELKEDEEIRVFEYENELGEIQFSMNEMLGKVDEMLGAVARLRIEKQVKQNGNGNQFIHRS